MSFIFAMFCVVAMLRRKPESFDERLLLIWALFFFADVLWVLVLWRIFV